ncbi:hypothetical protein ACTA71_000609 [Dictyostelium dimigraforme]
MGVNNSQITSITGETTLSVNVTNPIFSFSPYYSQNTECYDISYEILIEVKSGISIKDQSNNGTKLSLIRKLQTNNKYLYKLSLSSIPFGNYYGQLNFTTDDYKNHTYILKVECNEYNIDNLKISIETNPYYINSGYFYYILSISGIEPGFPGGINIAEYFGFISNSLDPEFNYILQISPYFIQNLTQDIDITLLFGNNKKFSLKVKSYYANFNKQDLATGHEDKFFPSDILSTGINFTAFSYNCYPIFHSVVNTNIIRPYQLVQDISGSWFTVPIKGKKGNMTYVGVVYDKFINGNGSSIDYFNFSTNIQNQNIPKIGPTPIVKGFPSTNSITLFIVSINNTYPYQFSDFSYEYSNKIVRGWPYGFHSGNNNNYTNKISLIHIPEYSTSLNYYFGINNDVEEIKDEISKPITSTPPKLVSYGFTKVSSQNYLLRLEIESISGVQNIYTFGMDSPSIDSLVSGTINNGIFEIVVDFLEFNMIGIKDLMGSSTIVKKGDVISLEPLVTLQLPPEIDYKLINFQNNLWFLKNNISLEEDSYNIVYINSSDTPHDKPISFYLNDIISYPFEREDMGNLVAIKYPFIYNTSSGLFECKFIVPKNNMFGTIQYMVRYDNEYGFYSNELIPQLYVNDDTVLDNQGPIFSSFEKIRNGLVISTAKTETIGWNFNITDDLNGFESGYIKVMGSVDSSTYHFNFTMDDIIIGDKFNFQYQILINITQPCITQEYRIVKVLLFDTNKIASRFDLYPAYVKPASILNPFFNFLDQGLNITILSFTCSNLQTTANLKPKLLSFTVSTTTTTIPTGGIPTIDVGATNRSISFEFSIDSASTIKLDQLPIIYITSLFSGLVECFSKIVSNDANNVFYRCSTEIPLGFGFPNSLIFSLYGIVNNGGYFYGYSNDDIQDVQSANYYVNTALSLSEPVIKSTERYFSDDDNGELVIFGRGFSKVDKVDFIYSDSNLQPNSATSLSIYGSSVIKVGRIQKTKYPFHIKISTSDNFKSNLFTVKPIYFDSSIPPKSSPTIPTISPIPTNAPQKCQGNPECGGKNQGYCSSTTGCICYPPWIGTTCSSQIIIVPQPSINKTSPQVEIPTKVENNGQSSTETNNKESQKMIFKSLISLVSLRELDFNNKEVNNYIFDQWIYTPINQFKNQYFTTISNTNITATLEWFNQSTFIQFANQNLTMNPSSIKYTIEISKYQFSRSLNQLQLVMAASLTSNSNDICSLNQFGNTSTGDDSNYLKIQIENHSLYGRFIKRAIIDNTVKSISNVLLDSSLNIIDSSTSSLQSYIGITIPFYSDSIIVDPDFSVLIDSKSASDQDNSICTNKKSGLTTAQLAGIIIGSIAFAAMIVIITIYIFVKRNNQKKFRAAINKKMIEMKGL